MMGTPSVPFLWSFHLHHYHLHNQGYALKQRADSFCFKWQVCFNKK